MKIKIVKKQPTGTNILIVPFFKDQVDASSIAEFSFTPIQSDFSGKKGEKTILYHPTKKLKVFLLGLGKPEELNQSAKLFRRLAIDDHSKWKSAITMDLSHLPVDMVFQAVQGFCLAGYAVGVFKTDAKSTKLFNPAQLKINIIHPDEKIASQLAKEAVHTATTQVEMMKLVNSPANQKTPNYIADYVTRSGKENNFKVKILKGKQLEKEGLHALIAVGQGSANPPVLIQMEYQPAGKKSKKPALGLVGKGITFDTGGLSIKGSQNLHYMKSDMGGAAAVIGAIELAAKLKLDIHLVGIIPSAENSVDANSIRPGDVISSYSGKTIEIIDTDAEGRLILADGLSYVEKNFHPKTVIDLATLTGSTVRTLGYAAGGLFTNNDSLATQLIEAGQQTHERLWQLPLWDDYSPDIASDIADVRNFSGRPLAGAIVAAKFLEFFIKDHPRWAHLDIAGVAFGDSEFTKMKSASGYGIQLLIAFMRNLNKS